MNSSFSRTPRYHSSKIIPAANRTSAYSRVKPKNGKRQSGDNKFAPLTFNGTLLFIKRNIFSILELDLAPDLVEVDLQMNHIQNFHGLPSLQYLQRLDLSDNPLSSFFGFPDLPKLEYIDLTRTPLSKNPNFRIALIILLGKSLVQINKERILPSERNMARTFPPRTDELLRHGWEITPMPPRAEDVPKILASLSITKTTQKEKKEAIANSLHYVKLTEYQTQKLQQQNQEVEELEEKIQNFQNQTL